VPECTDVRLNRIALREVRKLKGQSVTGLAEAAGIRQAHLSNLEAGRRQASPDLIRRLADALDVPVGCIAPVEADYEIRRAS
jgi:transcriptional regulator with XRE-family HTH domain